VRGVESEAVLPFAAITDLLWPLHGYLAKLPAIQREALEVCLALSAGPPQGPLAACAGALDRCGAQLTSVAQIKATRPTSWNWANYGIVVMGLRPSRTVDTAAIGVHRGCGNDMYLSALLMAHRGVSASRSGAAQFVEWLRRTDEDNVP
jgi:hypothetical protein